MALAQLNSSAPWPRFHGNNASTGQGGAAGAHGILKWTLFSNAFFPPIVGPDGTVYVSAADSKVHALNPADGSEKWSVASNSVSEGAPAIDQSGRLFFGDGGGYLTCVNASTGNVTWSEAIDGPVDSSPAIESGGSVIVATLNGYIDSINPSTGALNWDFPVGSFDSGASVTSNPTLDSSGNIYFGDTSGTYFSLASTGVMNWMHTTDGSTLGFDPCVDSVGNIYLVSQNDGIVSVDSANNLRWTNGPHGNASPSVDTNGHILYSDQSDAFTDLDPTTGNVLWADPFLSNSAAAIAPDGTIYVDNASGSGFFALSEADGSMKWQIQNIPGAGNPAIGADGSVYFTDVNGVLYAVGTNSITSFYASPTSVVGGNSTHGVVQVASAAPSSGYTVNLQSDNADATVPSAVTMASGAKGVSFTISTAPVATAETADITASIDGDTQQVTITLNPQTLTNFYVNPTTVVGGHGSRGVVQISSNAPFGGTSVKLQSGSSDATVPTQASVPPGSAGVSFSISTLPVSSPELVTLTAALGSSSLQTSLTITPYPISNFYTSPSSVTGGHGTYGVVQLSGPAATGGDVVYLDSTSSDAGIPGQVTVPQGSTGVSFFIATNLVSYQEIITLTATLGLSTQSTTLTLNPYGLSNFYASPSTVVGGGTTRGVVQLLGPAAAAGNTVTISYGGLSTVAPTVVTVPQLQNGVSFAIPTSPVSSNATYTLSATFAGTTLTTTLTITTPPISAFYVSPATVAGGTSTNGVVRLGGYVGQIQDGITLQSSSGDVTLPTLIYINSGSNAASFGISTSTVNASENVTLTATLGSSSMQTSLTVNPIELANFYISPSTVTGGTSTRGVVQLNGLAGPAGAVITLACPDANVTLPVSVTVPAGQSGLSFPIRTNAVATEDQPVITATQSSVSLQQTLTINP